VKQLDLEKGEVDLEGKVDSLTYLSKNTDNRDESFLKMDVSLRDEYIYSS